MNIRQAKETIRDTLEVYLAKNPDGTWRFPVEKQRPILLMGPPGIGKTAIVEQLASECGTGLVSYNMTHHTRQSAVGLPHLVEKEYQGQMMTVTAYTVSEIVASIYDCMEATGRREGILFIDEINCVSETLAPTMLQFLQKKMFGSFRIPEGWVIAAAANPREYNRSARDYDIAVLDRVRRLDVSPDLDTWLSYASAEGVHGAVLSYLACRPAHFFRLRPDADIPEYVTARGWEDLSAWLTGMEERGKEADVTAIRQYITIAGIADEFADYYRVYRKYGRDCGLNQTGENDLFPIMCRLGEKAGREERDILTALLLDRLGTDFFRYAREEEKLRLSAAKVRQMTAELREKSGSVDAVTEVPDSRIAGWKEQLRIRREYGLVSRREAQTEEQAVREMQEDCLLLREKHAVTPEQAADILTDRQDRRESAHREQGLKLEEKLNRAFQCLETSFGPGEMLAFVRGLSRNENAVRFLKEHRCEAYLRNSRNALERYG